MTHKITVIRPIEKARPPNPKIDVNTVININAVRPINNLTNHIFPPLVAISELTDLVTGDSLHPVIAVGELTDLVTNHPGKCEMSEY